MFDALWRVFLSKKLFTEPDKHGCVPVFSSLDLHPAKRSLAVLLAILKRIARFFMLVDEFEERVVANLKKRSSFARSALQLAEALDLLERIIVRLEFRRTTALVLWLCLAHALRAPRLKQSRLATS